MKVEVTNSVNGALVALSKGWIDVARAREMLRDLVLAAVPKHIEAEPENSQSYADGFNDAIDCTIANINALFWKETPMTPNDAGTMGRDEAVKVLRGYSQQHGNPEDFDLAIAALQAQGEPVDDDDDAGKDFFAVPEGLHPNTVNLVARFTTALAEKLAAAERKYGYSDGWADAGWMDECRQKLVEHIAKGDPRDVAAYCAFLWHHGESTAGATPPTPKPDAVAGLVEKAYAGCTIWRGSLRVSVTETEAIEHRTDADEAFCDLAQRALDSLAAAWDAAALAQGANDGR